MIENVEKNLKHIRELKNFTQEHLATQLGLSIRAYSKIETGETQLTIKRLNEISTILEVTPQEIIGFDEKQIFNHCEQSGNIGAINNNLPDKLISQYEKHISHLESEIIFLRAQMS